jgi:hypothetical protein
VNVCIQLFKLFQEMLLGLIRDLDPSYAEVPSEDLEHLGLGKLVPDPKKMCDELGVRLPSHDGVMRA